MRYVRALDARDHSDSFIGIWSTLEYLTNSVGNYDQIIRRAKFLFSDADRFNRFNYLLLEHLRDVRNQLVHTAAVRSNIEVYLYQLKGITEVFLRFHLRHGREFPHLQEQQSTWTRRWIENSSDSGYAIADECCDGLPISRPNN